MLTYPLSKESGRSLYEQLYEGIRRDILSGTLPAHQRLPSKRALAQHLEVSIITVQNAYEQLAAEGYIYSQEKRGYYVSPVERPLQAGAPTACPTAAGAGAEDLFSGPCDQFHRPGVFSLYRLGPPHAGDAAGAGQGPAAGRPL